MAGSRLARKQSGFSLVELMVSMVLGLMLIAGAVSIYLASKRSYIEVEQVAAVTENARFSEQIMGDALRHIGFLGEVTPNRVEVASGLTAPAGDCTDAGAGAYDFLRLAFAVTATTKDVPGCIDDAYVPAVGPKNDVLIVKHVLPQPHTDGAREGRDPNDPYTTIDTPGPLQNGRVYVMANSVGGLLFDGSLPPSISTGGQYPGGSAWPYQYEVFYIRDKDQADDDSPLQLSRKVLSYNSATAAMEFETEDLAEGVEYMQLLFGYDSDGDGDVDSYKDPAAITGANTWSGVESVEVFMLIRSATKDAQYTDTKTYQLGGVSVGPFNDEYRRLISHTSVSLRNLKLMIRGDAS
jgi:type IV pilus assembly protein PilW